MISEKSIDAEQHQLYLFSRKFIEFAMRGRITNVCPSFQQLPCLLVKCLYFV